MKAVLILSLYGVALTAIPASIASNEAARVSGVNGWDVPSLNGLLSWLDWEEGKALLEAWELVEKLGLTLTPVSYYLYTTANPTKGQQITDSAQSIAASNFNPKNPTRIIIHGWTESYTVENYKNIRNAILSLGNYNVIIVDWARARGEYISAVVAVPTVGQLIAGFVNYLVTNHGLSLNDLHVIGHSLGAHVAGHTGQNVMNGKIEVIVGLDAALPLFCYDEPKKRLSSGDAKYVECMHTNGGKLGILDAFCDADFYPNGGKTQPGCPLDIFGKCSHQRSVIYYAEAVLYNNFGAIKCRNYQAAVANQCGSTFSSIRMGADTNKFSAAGCFNVNVKSGPPYGVSS